MIFAIALAVASATVPSADAVVADVDQNSIMMTNALMRFGTCIARHHERDVQAMLATSIASKQEAAAMGKAARADFFCDLSGFKSLQISPVLLTGSIFEAYYHRRLWNAGDLKVNAAWPVIPVGADEPRNRVRSVQLMNMGACIAASNPAGAAKLLATRPLSYGEKSVAEALTPEVRKCGKAAGVRQMVQQELRAAVAVGLVNRLQDRRLASAGTSTDLPHA